jgi:hypothetical protein
MDDIDLKQMRKECGYNVDHEFDNDPEFQEAFGDDGPTMEGLIAYANALEELVIQLTFAEKEQE